VNPTRIEVMNSLEGFIRDAMPSLLKAEDDYWQPMDFSPDLRTEEGFEAIRELQAEARELPDEVMTVLIGDMVTEEALPSYSSWIAQLDGFDRNGEPKNSWGDWLRRWTSEENRHGDLLNRWLYLCGRVDMREIEVTVQNLLADGGDVQTGNDPYRAFVYTSFQEIATNYSHRNVAALAKKAGADSLGRLCRFIAGDESRHARAYKLFYTKVLEADTNEALLALHDMIRRNIMMPAMNMRERGAGVGETFKRFAAVAERNGVYTRHDYVEILEGLIEHWDIQHLTGLSPDAAKAQDYLCGICARYRKVLDRQGDKLLDHTPYTFSWILPNTAEATG
jgi:acyl-[acyl-carrier-protein] desaturase